MRLHVLTSRPHEPQVPHIGASVQGVRSHDPTARSQNPILDALCRHRVAARLCTCHRTYRALARYPVRAHGGTSYSRPNLHVQACARVIAHGPKLSRMDPQTRRATARSPMQH
ncbi:hypothetical protein PIB30_070709 [Stylosanthes scabra]|uniref:Uncharacterized protein n=1 Tax=Stylosanthes scabra TaxID=79078 RepID=A0ABU6QPN0_9FABA|nr:hypothetical protein [Stylosanthes scabra]